MKRPYEAIGRDFSVATSQRMCLEKKQFPSKNKARDHGIKGQKNHGNSATVPYKCSICHKFHLTSINREEGNVAKRKSWSRKDPPQPKGG